MWPHIHTRILASLLLFQVTMFGYFGVKKFYYAPFLIPLPEIPNMELVFRSFIPPSLTAEESDDDQFEEALSQVSRTGSFV
ncbi:unnamed protein product [Ilex paraguariensis]|uniref:Uncharacterized protein n=1 Tax=Ilex paraguariensis TaxID=185542 RepID=A0ABC8TDG1_9AQUA